jgi:hypothetical protein
MPDDALLLMSQAEYGQHRGVSQQAISKLARAGKLVLDPPTGKIDAAASDRALGEVRERIIARDEPSPVGKTSGYTPPAEGGLTRARTATEVYRARIAQLEYEERVGKLLLRDDVMQSIRACGDAISREIELWPTRADELAAAFRQNDVHGLRSAMKNMSRDLLIILSKKMQQLSGAS